jgi:hypothetical protein
MEDTAESGKYSRAVGSMQDSVKNKFFTNELVCFAIIAQAM